MEKIVSKTNKPTISELLAKPPVKYELLIESSKSQVNNLIRVYKENPQRARVMFTQGREKYTFNKMVYFDKGGNNFEIVWFVAGCGISITNKKYHTEKKVLSLICKAGKYWALTRQGSYSRITPMSYSDVQNMMYKLDGNSYKNNRVYDIFAKKFFWLKFIQEKSDFHFTPFNTIIRRKLFGLNDMIKYKYNAPINVAKFLYEKRQFLNPKEMPRWKECQKVLINLDKLTPELFYDPNFMDACKMAGALGKKVNCIWSKNRLREEHDVWSKEVTKILIECEELRLLEVKEIYKAFADFSGYQLLLTNREMMAEGRNQSHCVATYIDEVDNGRCAIYHVEGFTLQVIIKTHHQSYSSANTLTEEQMFKKYGTNKLLHKNQFLGYKNDYNITPERELLKIKLTKEVEDMIEKFNLSEARKYLGDIQVQQEKIEIGW